MHKTKASLTTLTAILALSVEASATSETWLVTEENSEGIKGAQGKWTVHVEGSNMSGVAEMQADNGDQFTYKLEGSIKDGVYVVKMNDRSDGKKIGAAMPPRSEQLKKLACLVMLHARVLS